MFELEYILVYSSIIFFLCGLVVWFKEFIFRLYVLQLKEYRSDKIMDYVSTAEAKTTLFGMRNRLRITLLFCFAAGIIFRPLLYLSFGVATLYIIGEFLVFIKQVYYKTYRKPLRTKRIALLGGLGLLLWCVWYYMYLWWMGDAMVLGIFLGLLFSLLVLPIFIRALRWSTDWLFQLKKKRIFAVATQRMQEYAGCTTIGISGSFGKSSVKMLLSHILGKKYAVAFPPDNTNTEMGISRYILDDLPKETKYFVTEFGTYSTGETTLLGDITQHTHGFLTGLNNQHEALFGSLEAAIAAETEIIAGILERKGILYINWESEHVREVVYPKELTLVRYGVHEEGCDARCRIISLVGGITQGIFTYKGHTHTFSTDLIGEHALTNLTGVIACCFDLGVPFETLASTTPTLQSVQKTFHHVEYDGRILIDDTYNINQDGVIAGVQAAKYFDKPVVAVIDDIIELGPSATQTHRLLGERLATMEVSAIFLTGKEFAPSLKKGLQDAGYAGQIFLLKKTGNKLFIEQLGSVSKQSTVVFMGRFTKPYLEKFLPMKD